MTKEAESEVGKGHSKYASGEAESLWGKIDPKDFGSKITREKAPIQLADRSAQQISWELPAKPPKNKPKSDADLQLYKAKSKETELAYGLLLGFLQEFYQDQPRDLLKNAADEVITTLKQETVKDLDKKRQIEHILGPISSEKYSGLVNLVKKFTDFTASALQQQQQPSFGESMMQVENGISIVFSDIEEQESQFLIEEEEEEEDELIPEESQSQLALNQFDYSWLKEPLSSFYPLSQTNEIAVKIQNVLQNKELDLRQCENELVSLLEFDKFELIQMLLENRKFFLLQLQQKESTELHSQDDDHSQFPLQIVDLSELEFEQRAHFMSNKQCKIPESSKKIIHPDYEEIQIPAPITEPPKPGEELISIGQLPLWIHAAFGGASHTLNRIQSKVYPTAFCSDENMLICAPTGAGKTNAALLTILRVMQQHRDERTGKFALETFKIVYIAPMKALVQEILANFSSRLSYLGIKVGELTGDSQLSKQEIAASQIIITTPEKWDIITRKASEKSYLKLIKLVIIDEIHLLHDERGPVLEAIVARTLRSMEENQELIRIVALSATLPNYVDVAKFLRINSKSGMFFFPNSYRPCPLAQQFIGITKIKPLKRFQISNEICYKKLVERAGKCQIIVFVHSRRETYNVAKIMRDLAMERGTIGSFFPEEHSATREILRQEAENATNPPLKDILPFGFAIHHAGLNKSDRKLVEDLFADGHIQVLFSTATLAWGVNLPAHSVIIKGTQVFSPSLGRWTEISPQDMLQMLGRAGRPQFDREGEGIVITGHEELQYYLSLSNMQLPIESQMICKLCDNLNAEIASGTINSRDDAVNWLGYTYLFVRMMRDPSLYGIKGDAKSQDQKLRKKRTDLIHSACIVLEKDGLIKYDKRTGLLQGTTLGRIASHFYISHKTLRTFSQSLKPHMEEMDLLRVFSLAEEFSLIPVREEEKIELEKLLQRVPFPVRESCDEPSAKINVLLQSYISKYSMDGFALNADMHFITQNAPRLFRAIFEISVAGKWSRVASKALELSKMIQHRQWSCLTPLRQFPDFPSELVKNLERRDFPWERMFDLSPQQLGELVRSPKHGNLIREFIQKFPSLQINASYLPISPSALKLNVWISPNFETSSSELFWIFIEDVDGQTLLFTDQWLMKPKNNNLTKTCSCILPIFDPPSPVYYLNVVSDRWLGASWTQAISFENLVIPTKFAPPTQLLDLDPISIVLDGGENCSLQLNPIQTQIISSIQAADSERQNIFIGAPPGTGIETVIEFEIKREIQGNSNAKILIISPDFPNSFLSKRFPNCGILSHDANLSHKIFDQHQIIFSSVSQAEILTRICKTSPSQAISLFICQDIHSLGSAKGPLYEVLLARLKLLITETYPQSRIILSSFPIADYKDICEWMNISLSFNFPLTTLRGHFEIIPYVLSGSPSNQMISLSKMVFAKIKFTQKIQTSLLIVPNRKMAKIIAREFVNSCLLNDLEPLSCPSMATVEDSLVNDCSTFGIGLLDESFNLDHHLSVSAVDHQNYRCLIVSKEDFFAHSCMNYTFDIIAIVGTEYFEASQMSYSDYSLLDVISMTSNCAKECLIFCPKSKQESLAKFLFDSIPIESHLHLMPHDYLITEICLTKAITNKQDAVEFFGNSFLYQRLSKTPTYYSLEPGTSISEYLSDLIENALEELDGKFIQISDDFDLHPTALGTIASSFGIPWNDVEMLGQKFTASFQARKSPFVFIEALAACSVWEDFSPTLQLRGKEEHSKLAQSNNLIPCKFAASSNFWDLHVKMAILLQFHISRIALTPELQANLKSSLPMFHNLLQAAISIAFLNECPLDLCIMAMEFSQMLTQALWDDQPNVLQIPGLSTSDVNYHHQVETVYEFLELEIHHQIISNFPSDSTKILAQKFCNSYPSISVDLERKDGHLIVGLTRDNAQDGENEIPHVCSSFIPWTKIEEWWIMITDEGMTKCLYHKKIRFAKSFQLSISLKDDDGGGNEKGKMFLFSDCYIGCDQEFDF